MNMNYNQFSNLSCYEEFEIHTTLAGISKIDVLKEIGHKIDDYYFFVSTDGIFNWFDLNGNHVEDPGILKEIDEEYIPRNITKCVGNCVFFNRNLLTSIIIPNSVTRIGDNAFSYCESLKEIVIPNNVKSIGKYAFHFCESLTSIIIPNSVTSIGRDAFSYCKALKEITILNSVTNIGDGAFYSCESLTSINISDSITRIGNMAFSYCNSLKEVTFKGKTLKEVKQMKHYPFGIEDENLIVSKL